MHTKDDGVHIIAIEMLEALGVGDEGVRRITWTNCEGHGQDELNVVFGNRLKICNNDEQMTNREEMGELRYPELKVIVAGLHLDILVSLEGPLESFLTHFDILDSQS